MYNIKENEKGILVIDGQHGDETIDVIHCCETIEGLREDVATPYIVAESCTNFARLHLVTDFSEDQAAQQVHEYLFEEEGDENPELLAVIPVSLG